MLLRLFGGREGWGGEEPPHEKITTFAPKKI